MIWRPSSRQVAFGGTGVSVLGSTIPPADAVGASTEINPSTANTAATERGIVLRIIPTSLGRVRSFLARERAPSYREQPSGTADRLHGVRCPPAQCLLPGFPQHPDDHRQQRPVLLEVDQKLGEGAALRTSICTNTLEAGQDPPSQVRT
jgi:hypothetical protein